MALGHLQLPRVPFNLVPHGTKFFSDSPEILVCLGRPRVQPIHVFAEKIKNLFNDPMMLIEFIVRGLGKIGHKFVGILGVKLLGPSQEFSQGLLV